LRSLKLLSFFLLIFFFLTCNYQPKPDYKFIEQQILNELKKSVKAWNDGNIVEYMQSYQKTDSVRFAGNGTVSFGWQTVLERYKKGYPDRSAMGFLEFSELDVRILSKNYALVFGRWKLTKNEGNPSGLFTLLFERRGDTWRIVHDHSSSAN